MDLFPKRVPESIFGFFTGWDKTRYVPKIADPDIAITWSKTISFSKQYRYGFYKLGEVWYLGYYLQPGFGERPISLFMNPTPYPLDVTGLVWNSKFGVSTNASLEVYTTSMSWVDENFLAIPPMLNPDFQITIFEQLMPDRLVAYLQQFGALDIEQLEGIADGQTMNPAEMVRILLNPPRVDPAPDDTAAAALQRENDELKRRAMLAQRTSFASALLLLSQILHSPAFLTGCCILVGCCAAAR